MPHRAPYILAVTSLVGCHAPEPLSGDVGGEAREMLQSAVMVAGVELPPFEADLVTASIGHSHGRDELIVSGMSADRSRSFGLVLDTQALASGEASVAGQGAVYMEFDPSGNDWLFDGPPSGHFVYDGALAPGREISASFDLYIPSMDAEGDRLLDERVHLVGSLAVRILPDEE